MRVNKLSLSLLLVFFCSLAPGRDLLRLNLRAQISYEDPDTAYVCSFHKTRDIVVASDIDGSKLSYTSFFPRFTSHFSRWFFFNADEISRIKLHRDSKRRLWLKTLGIDGNHLLWLIYNLSDSDDCRPTHEHKPSVIGLDEDIIDPPYPLVSIEPASTTLDFELDGIEEGILRSYSNALHFRGKRKDGSTFSGKLMLRQTPFD